MNRLLCWLFCHDYTSRGMEGLPPETTDLPHKDDTSAVTLIKFRRYATMYCKRCGKVYSNA